MDHTSRRQGRSRALLVLAALLAAVPGAGCASTGALTEETPAGPAPVFVSGADLAASLGLNHAPYDRAGKVALAASDGARILLFPETTVASVRGVTYTALAPIRLRDDDAWVSAADASAIRALWAQAPGPAPDWEPTPLLPRPPTSRAQPAAEPAGWDEPTAAELRAWTVPLRRPWQYIVIHHSGTDTGNAASFHQAHLARGWDGLGYDFVIGNGHGSPDGAVEVGYRWRQQKVGAHAGNDLMNERGVGVCLVGDFTKSRPTPAQLHALGRLCTFLTERCGIPRANLRLHTDVRTTECPGPNFPRAFLRGDASGVVAGRSRSTRIPP